jgi:hypothetical protein
MCENRVEAVRDSEFIQARTACNASFQALSRRSYRNVSDTKSGKRREMTARLSFNTACELGFRGSLAAQGILSSVIVIAPLPGSLSRPA